jgi:hypothetical protein
MTPTRYTPKTGIQIARLGTFWQHIDTNDGRRAQIGPQYRTKAELLADHERYLIAAGWLDDDQTDSANARLIAALQGARAALRRALPYCPPEDAGLFVGEWLDEINAALLKACPQCQDFPNKENK